VARETVHEREKSLEIVRARFAGGAATTFTILAVFVPVALTGGVVARFFYQEEKA
jgi:multidrug efflux pump subunit AcrB